MKRHLVISGCLAAAFAISTAGAVADDHDPNDARNVRTATPIKHLVVIFQENISYDHYFGTYPDAMNLPGETPFKAKRHTPVNNNLVTPLDVNHDFRTIAGLNLLTNNPNSSAAAPAAPNNSRHNGADASNPFRLSPSQASTADQGHNDMPEQAAYNNGNMDGFPAWAGTAGTAATGPLPPPAAVATKGLTMGYYDGNTVTALWNYAQHYAMNDNSFATQFGPSTPGAVNLISGQANGFSHATNVQAADGHLLHPTHEAFGDASHLPSNITMIGDADPEMDVCSNPTIDQVTMAGRNIGDLLNQQNITWGWFEGGFNLQTGNPNGSTGCARFTVATAALSPASASTDYIPHHQPFQYYASTRNPTHARPSAVAAIGHSKVPNTNTPDPANHQYDSADFFTALNAGNLPAVTFLKAPAFQDGHAGYSNPIDEQAFIVKAVNAVQGSRFWTDTVIVILYDDSDGWYDHQMPPIVDPSFNPDPSVDVLNGAGTCNLGLQQGRPTRTTPLNGAFGPPAWGRCGYGTRQPLLVISPFARRNHIDHTLTDQSSVLKFIEDNWLAGDRIQQGGSFDTVAGTIENMFDFDHHGDNDDNKLILDPSTGAVVFASHHDDDDDDDHGHDGDGNGNGNERH